MAVNQRGRTQGRATRRESIASAAIDVLATRGLRGLTHRAVDAAAGLGAGSVNYHAPTRAHLIDLALEELFARDLEVVGEVFGGIAAEGDDLSPNTVIEAMAGFVVAMTTGSAARRVVARHVLLGHAQHAPEIRATFDTQRAAFVAFTAHVLASLYPERDPAVLAETIVIVVEGLVQRQVLIGAEPLGDELASIIGRLVNAS